MPLIPRTRCLFFLGVLAATGVALAAEPVQLAIGNGSQWSFVNSQWKETEGAGIAGERTGDGLQGYCLAFLKDRAYQPVEEVWVCRLRAA